MFDPSSFSSSLLELPLFFQKTMPGIPLGDWWLPAGTLLLLGAVALIDLGTARVPDRLILPAFLVLLTLEAIFVSILYALISLAAALLVGGTLWALNRAWRLFRKGDALGMGDAKWSMVAAAGFGLLPVSGAWGIGACCAILWMAGAHAVRRPIGQVHFVPFLFIGLLISLGWIWLR